MKRLWHCLCAAVVLGAAPAHAAAPLKVVATFSILAEMAREIGGDRVEVTSLVEPGGDAHVYQPTPADARTLSHAGLIVVNGLAMEGWIDRLIAAAAAKAPVVVASQGVAPLAMEDDEHKGADGKPRTVIDPHGWQDLANGQLYARNIGAALAAADPANAAFYQDNVKAYTGRLASLDAWVRGQIAKVPEQQRKIITSHDAFGYFGHAYGVTFMAPAGISTDAEPSAAGLGRLVRQIKREHVKALFIETMTDPRLLAALAKESGAVIGGSVYSDSLSPPGGPADTYEAMFRHNVPMFVAAMMKN